MVEAACQARASHAPLTSDRLDMGYPYDPSRTALLYPARNSNFFPTGCPASEPALSAELSRLAYAPFEREPAANDLVRATLSRIGFERCEFFSSASTAAFLARASTKSAVLVFRGTEPDPRDWATDLDALLIPWPEGGRVHRGFAEALDTVWELIAVALGGVDGRLLFTGHSLGGALATLAASRYRPDALLTFGSPRVGDVTFAMLPNSPSHLRFVNCCDVVARVPPEALWYRHSGMLQYIDREGVVHPAPSDAQIAADQERARLEYRQLWAWRPGTLLTRDAADHTPANYAAALRERRPASPN